MRTIFLSRSSSSLSWEDGSIGIDDGAVVKNIKEMMERIQYIQDEFDSPALIEEYIEGREIYAGILGSYEQHAGLAAGGTGSFAVARGHAQDRQLRREIREEYRSLQAHEIGRWPKNLDEETTKRLSDTALAAYRALKLRDYGRIDMRLAPNGDVYVIEANPNPWLASRQEFAMAAKAHGLSYTETIGSIVDLAMSRYLNANLVSVASMH